MNSDNSIPGCYVQKKEFTPDMEVLFAFEGVCFEALVVLFGGSAKLAAAPAFLLLRADVGASTFFYFGVEEAAVLFDSSFVSSSVAVFVDFLAPGIAGIFGILMSLALFRNCIS